MSKLFDVTLNISAPSSEHEAAFKEAFSKNLEKLLNDGGPALRELLSVIELTVTETKPRGEIHLAQFESEGRKAILEDGRTFDVITHDIDLRSPAYMHGFGNFGTAMAVVEINEDNTCRLVKKGTLIRK